MSKNTSGIFLKVKSYKFSLCFHSDQMMWLATPPRIWSMELSFLQLQPVVQVMVMINSLLLTWSYTTYLSQSTSFRESWLKCERKNSKSQYVMFTQYTCLYHNLSNSSKSASWQLSVKSKHYEHNSQQGHVFGFTWHLTVLFTRAWTKEPTSS